MEDMALVIMEKEAETDFLSRELGSYTLNGDIGFIERAFASVEDGKMTVYLYLTMPGEFDDREFNAILDGYNPELYHGIVSSISEDEDNYNPGWILKFPFIENDDDMERKLNKILQIHIGEVGRIAAKMQR